MTEIETAKKIAEVSKKLESAKSNLESKHGHHHGQLESDIRFNRDTSLNANEVKYAAQRVESLQKELDKLK